MALPRSYNLHAYDMAMTLGRVNSKPGWARPSPSLRDRRPDGNVERGHLARGLRAILRCVFRLALHAPEIPPNTGNAIRLAANTGVELHLVRPLGFRLDERAVRRAGLDYHDLAEVVVHDGDAEFAAWVTDRQARVFAFTTDSPVRYTDIAYRPGDVLLFGRESAGLPDAVSHSPWVTGRVRLPMRPSNRSLNLANAAAVAVYEAWRQHGFR